MKKRLIALLLVICLSVGLLSTTVLAAGVIEPGTGLDLLFKAGAVQHAHHCGRYNCHHAVCACGKYYSCVNHTCCVHTCGTMSCKLHSCPTPGCTIPSCVAHVCSKPGCTKPGCTIAHEIKFVTDGGTLYAPVKVYENSDFLLYSYVPTKVGYTFGGWYYDIGCTKPVVNFKPTCDMTLYAKWLDPFTQSLLPYMDVPVSSYYYNATCWANKCGVIPASQYLNPDQPCTRADMLTFLWRAAGSPQSNLTYMPFTDVSEKTTSYEAVKWALEMGITKGTNDLKFRPYETVDRAEVVTFLYRFSGASATTANPYKDVAADDWFYDAVRWADARKITNGTNNLMFRPYDECTRAQVLTFLHRYFG